LTFQFTVTSGWVWLLGFIGSKIYTGKMLLLWEQQQDQWWMKDWW